MRSQLSFLVLTIPLALLLPILPIDRISPGLGAAIAQTQTDRRNEALQQINQATWMYSPDFPEISLALYEQAMQVLREIGDRDTEAAVLKSLAGTARLEGRLEQALSYYQQTIPIYQELSRSPVDRQRQLGQASETLNIIGDLHQALGQPEQALAAYQQALAIDRRADDPVSEAGTLNNMGTFYRATNQPAQALAAYQQAIALYQQVGGGFYDEPSVLNRLGLLYQEQGQFEPALAAYQQALGALEQASALLEGLPPDFILPDRIMTLENISTLYAAQGQADQALSYAQQAETVLDSLLVGENQFRQAYVLADIGRFYLSDRQQERASHYFERALTLVRDSIDRYAEVNILSSIELAYTEQGQLEQTLSYRQRSAVIFGEMDLPENQGTSLRVLGDTYRTLGEWESALATYQQALAAYRRLEQMYDTESQDIPLVLHRMGGVYGAQGQTEQALTAYQQALAIYQERGATLGQIQVLESLGKLFESQGQTEQAQQHYQQAEAARILLNRELDEMGAAGFPSFR